MSTPNAPDPSVSTRDSDPSLRGGGAGLITAAVLFCAAFFGLPLDPVLAATIGAALAGVVGPLVTMLVTRAKAWSPASVAELQEAWRELADELQDRNPPAVVTNQELNPTEASELHPGALGFGIDADPATEAIGTEDGLPGRHVRYQDRQEGTR